MKADNYGWRQLIWHELVERHLSNSQAFNSHNHQNQLQVVLQIVFDYPISERLFAIIDKAHLVESPSVYQQSMDSTENDRLFAKRFEIYLNGVEIANGWEELRNPHELTSIMQKQIDDCADQREIDPRMLCIANSSRLSGVAMGVDRLFSELLGLHDVTLINAFKFQQQCQSMPE